MKPRFSYTQTNSVNYVPAAPFEGTAGTIVFLATSAQNKDIVFHVAPQVYSYPAATWMAATTFQSKQSDPIHAVWAPPAGEIVLKVGVSNSYDGSSVPNDFIELWSIKATVE